MDRPPEHTKGLLKSAIRDDNPVVFLQAGGRGGEQGEVPDGEHLIPLGVAEVKRSGNDVTIVAIGSMVRHALRAADDLAKEGVEAEVLDPRTLHPLDEDAILRLRSQDRSPGRRRRGAECRGAASHIALVVERAFNSLRAPIRRVTTPDVAIPYSPALEKAVIPDKEAVLVAVNFVLGRRGISA